MPNHPLSVDSNSKPDRLQIILWTLGILAGLGLMIYNLPKFQVGAHYDDAAYITLARSFLHGEGYGLISYPGAPRIANYPFGYPLALSLIAAFSPNELAAYKYVSVVATLINASLLFWGWRLLSRSLSHWWALAISLLYLFSPVTIDLSGRVMSEPLFLTCYLLAMLIAEWGCKSQIKHKIVRWLWPVGLGILLVAIPFVRTIGIAFTFSILLYLLLVKRRNFYPILGGVLVGMILLTTLIVAVTPVTWPDLLPKKYLSDRQAALLIGLTSSLNDESTNLAPTQTETLAEELVTQRGLSGLVQDYLIDGPKQHFGKDLRTAIIPFAGTGGEEAFASRIGIPFLPIFIGWLIFGITIFGYIRWVKLERLTVFILSSIIYFAALFAWVWNEPRFLNPIAPQLLTAFWLGVSGILLLLARGWQRVFKSETESKTASETAQDNSRFIKPFLAVLVSLILILSIYKSVSISDSRIHVGELSERTVWLRDNTIPEAIVMSEYPVIDYLYSNRQTAAIPMKNPTLAEFSDLLIQKKIDYILIAPQISWMKPKFEPAYSPHLTPIFPLIEALLKENRIQVVHEGQTDLITIYRVINR